MKYPLTIKGFEKQTLEVDAGGLFRGPKLLINGAPAPAGAKRGELKLRRDDGTEVTAMWRPQALGLDVPRLMVDGAQVSVAEPLKWYVWVWSAVPLLLIFLGGALGALMGIIALAVNVRMFRGTMPTAAKFAVTAAVTIVAVILYVVLAALLLSATGQ